MKYIQSSRPRITDGAVLALLTILSLGSVGAGLLESGQTIHQLAAMDAEQPNQTLLAKNSPALPLPAKKVL